jgi:hypothetical protein
MEERRLEISFAAVRDSSVASRPAAIGRGPGLRPRIGLTTVEISVHQPSTFNGRKWL